MPPDSLAHPSPSSRLFRELEATAVINAPGHLPCFAERLGRLFGLGDTMHLDAATAYRVRRPGSAQEAVVNRLTDELANTRLALVRRILAFGDDFRVEEEPEFEPVLNAWLVLQRKIAAATRQFRDKVRKSMTEQGQTLARLAELDATFDHTMASYTGRCFSQIPRVLENAFRDRPEPSGPTTGAPPSGADWLRDFCQQARNLLLAELDVRLEPVLGLLEACQNEVNNAS